MELDEAKSKRARAGHEVVSDFVRLALISEQRHTKLSDSSGTLATVQFSTTKRDDGRVARYRSAQEDASMMTLHRLTGRFSRAWNEQGGSHIKAMNIARACS